jgi:4-hydroxy-tetrahydrodipicolinate reductase
LALPNWLRKSRAVQYVIGTTGLTDGDIAVDAAARHAVIVRAGNMSLV